ncbi:hypothetical protein [Actinomadura terrae]|uniref:hypothetical protein n=1 Tax=Actinomadura terrae TaxID=604353 RepID=UPI001FA6DACE|nr:hypothetical protein [Actinomadura terrae]
MNRFPARAMTAVAVAALGLGSAPTIARAAPVRLAAGVSECGARLDDWLNANGAVYKGDLSKRGGKSIKAVVDINPEDVVLILDGNRMEGRSYRFGQRAIVVARRGFTVRMVDPVCEVGTTVSAVTLTVDSSPEPLAHREGHIVRTPG